jgi:hypothetical protein
VPSKLRPFWSLVSAHIDWYTPAFVHRIMDRDEKDEGWWTFSKGGRVPVPSWCTQTYDVNESEALRSARDWKYICSLPKPIPAEEGREKDMLRTVVESMYLTFIFLLDSI